MIVCNNVPQYMKDALDSVLLQQTFRGKPHVIIVDNGSQDGRTVKFLNQVDAGSLYEKSQVTLVKLSAGQSSVAEANNKGLRMALDKAADYIAWIEPEAICAPERFKTQLDFLQSNPRVDIVGSNVLVFNENY